MSNTTHRVVERERTHRRHWIFGILTVASVGAVAVVIAISAGGKSSGTAGTSGVATGATNAMGMPIIATPGSASGVAVSDGVSATPNLWALGRVPLNVAVRPNWKLTNSGTDTITIGQPHVQVNEGCCPGSLTFDGPTTLAPAQTTGLTFELSMHPGMDGPHDMTIHVPVQHADGTKSVLDLQVTGDFRD